MKNEYFKFTEEVKEKFIKNLGGFEELREKAKKTKAEDTGYFDVIVSTDDLDRAGEIVRQDGWDFSNYKNNPVVLWGHDYYSIPIGVCTDIAVEGNKTRAKGFFFSAEINPFAQQVRKMYELGTKQGMGVGCTTSVGFIPKEFDEQNPSIITKAELLEFSFVPIPANQGVGPAQGRALTTLEAKALGIDAEMARFKGVILKESQAGDECSMDDGSPGILSSDPDDPDGPMVCIPQEEDKTKKTMKNRKTFKKGIDEEHDRHEEKCEKSFDEFREKCKALEGKEKSEKGFDIEKHLKTLRESLEDEHDLHREKNIEHFKSFKGPKEEKDFDIEKHVKAVHAEHDRYEDAYMKDHSKFEEKMKKSVEGADGEHDKHTDWIVGKMEDHQKVHRENIHEIADKMFKAFGEGDDTDEKKDVLSKEMKEKLSEAHEHLKAAKSVLEALHGGLADGDEEEGHSKPKDEESDGEGSRKEQRSSRASRTSADDDLNAHLEARAIVRGIEAAARDGLAKINDSIKDYYRHGSKK